MTRNQILARLFRALSGETQESFAQKTDVNPVLLAQYELGKVEPGRENLVRLAKGAGLTVEDGEEILGLTDTLRRPRMRAGQGIEDLTGDLQALVSRMYQRVLRLPPVPASAEGDSAQAGQQWELLQELPEDQQFTVVRVAPEFQNRALAQRVSEESVAQAAEDPERAAALARLAREIAERAGGGGD